MEFIRFFLLLVDVFLLLILGTYQDGISVAKFFADARLIKARDVLRMLGPNSSR